jgi:flagellar motor protein MotB
MSSLKKMALTLAIVPVGACVTPRAQPALPLLAGHNFSYSTEDREKVGLVQAFDDGKNTFLQFRDTPPPNVEIRRDTETEKIPFTPEDRYLVLNGVYDRLRITSADNYATVLNQTISVNPPTVEDLDAAPRLTRAPAVGIPESLQTMNAKLRVASLIPENATLEDRVRALVEQIEELHSSEQAAHLYVRSVRGSPRLVVKFEDGSAEVQVDETLLEKLGQAARAASRIYLHGHTDAYVASEAGTDLAVLRAVQVRQLLIALRADPQRIRMFYRGAGDFSANNSTMEGKALNRRVEIELRRW